MLLRHIRYFLAVAEQGNFTRAAEALHVSQPTLSQQIKQLEDALGAPLFDRSGRAVRLTDAGEAWMRYARLALQDLDAGARAIHDVATLARGHLRLAMTPTFTAYLVGPTIDAFYRRYPGITLSIEEMAQERIEALLAQDRLDLGIAFEMAQSAEVEATPLFSETLELMVGADHPLAAHRRPLRLAEWQHLPLALLNGDFATRQFIDRYCTQLGFRPQVAVEANALGAIVEIVRRGQLATLLPAAILSARALGDVHQRICAAPGYLAQHGVPQTPNELPRHSCLAYSLAEKPGQWQFTAGEESLSVTFTPRLIANNSLMLRDMLVAGLGIGSLPSFVADPEIAAGRLVQLFPEQIADVHQVFAVYPTRRHVQQKVSLFTELVREQGLMTAN